MLELVTVAVAADTAGSTDWQTYVRDYGIIVLVVVGWLTGRIARGSDLEQMRQERDAALERERQTNEVVKADVIPALVRSTEALLRVNGETR